MTITERLERVRADIARAAQRAGRDPRSIELVTVTKTRSAEEIVEAIRSGATRLGENYVQEARAKVALVSALLPGHGARWHLIGPVQTNKAKYLPGLVDVVESVDRLELASALAKRASAAELVLPVLVQVNVGREPQKAGCDPDGVEPLVTAVRDLPALRIEGLMAIPPECEDPEDARPHFRSLAELARKLVLRGLLRDPPILSMGMSHDFEAAIAEGATRVRIGTAIFGPRSPKSAA